MKTISTIPFKSLEELHNDVFLLPDLYRRYEVNNTNNSKFELNLVDYSGDVKIQLVTRLENEYIEGDYYISDVVEWPASDVTEEQLNNIFNLGK